MYTMIPSLVVALLLTGSHVKAFAPKPVTTKVCEPNHYFTTWRCIPLPNVRLTVILSYYLTTLLTHSYNAQQTLLPLHALKIGIFGGGTVGGGVVDILTSKSAYLKALTHTDITVSKICVRDATKTRDFTLPEGCHIVTNYDDILKDDTIDTVVEVMGGTKQAKDVVYQALKAGKHVVTANKALIAKYLPEIEDILATVNQNRESHNQVEFRYEAAVCGGIPIIRSLQSDFVGDEIAMISGIINGCTNYMLTSMDRDGKTYDETCFK